MRCVLFYNMNHSGDGYHENCKSMKEAEQRYKILDSVYGVNDVVICRPSVDGWSYECVRRLCE